MAQITQTMPVTLAQYLTAQRRKHGLPPELALLISSVAQTCQRIAAAVHQGALAGVLGSAGSANVQGEEQKKLDVIANDMMIAGSSWTSVVAGMASEEMDDILPIPADTGTGDYLLLFDPLDGSSNIDVNVSIGTIFSVLKRSGSGTITEQDFLQPGHMQAAAGYCLYGPQTVLVFTLGRGVVMFTLDMHVGEFVLTREGVTFGADTQEFAINMSNMRHWADPVRRYVQECLDGAEGPRGKNFNMRWVASMVAEVHRILTRGGIFMYPWDKREPQKPGKLRLMYEANPMSLLIEQAGGASTNGHQRILDVQPEKLHQRVAVILGAKNEVERLTRYHQL